MASNQLEGEEKQLRESTAFSCSVLLLKMSSRPLGTQEVVGMAPRGGSGKYSGSSVLA